MKNLNVTITDGADSKVNDIMREKGFKNRADCVEWLIERSHEELFREEK